MEFSNLINLVREKQNLWQNKDLAKKLNISPQKISDYTNNRVRPADNTIVTLCELAHEDPKLWLIQRQLLNSHGHAKTHWNDILELFKGIKDKSK